MVTLPANNDESMEEAGANRLGGESPESLVAVYASEEDLTDAIRQLEKAQYDMATISVLAKGMSEERHVIGFETPETHTKRWAKWGGLWGWVFGAFIFIPGIGHVAVGGYLLYLLATTGIGAVGGALAGTLTKMGIPEDGIPLYEADLHANQFLVIAHGSPDEVAKARELLQPTNHQRIDHHSATAATTGTPGHKH